ncbi:RING finger protein, partial [Aspergillus luchuensis IFO 4308]
LPHLSTPSYCATPGRGAGDGGNQNNAGAQNMAAGNQARDGQPDGLPRARVYQFGPFRIGFGAGRGDLFHNLHQQIHQGNAPVPQANNVNAPNARQIGFGFGFGRPLPIPAPQAAPNPASNVANMQTQLQQMEQQIVQEIETLRVTADQLHLVRLLQTELQRLRNLQANPTVPQSIAFQNPPAVSSSTSSVTMRRQFISDPQTPAMNAGDSRLPEGLSLPAGWSLIPLHSPEQGPSQPAEQRASPTVPETGTAQTSDPTSDSQVPPPTATVPAASQESEPAAATEPSTSQDLPNWQSGATSTATGSGVESLSQQWTDLAPETQMDGESTTADDIDGANHAEESDSASKGKARVATVEDVIDDET